MPETAHSASISSPGWARLQLTEPYNQLVESAFKADDIKDAVADPALSQDALEQELSVRENELLLLPRRELTELVGLAHRLADLEGQTTISTTWWMRARNHAAQRAVRMSARGVPLPMVQLERWLEHRSLTSGAPDGADWLEQRSVLKAEIDVARRAFTAAVFERGIQRALRSIVDERAATSYSDVLNVEFAPGLAELTREDLDVSDPTARTLQSMMRGMGGGSIAISGPRGVGKTTLLEAVRSGLHPVRPDTPQPQLSVMTSAPVEYDGRDFVLHLFAQLCDVVISSAIQSDILDPGSPVGSRASLSRRQIGLYLASLLSRMTLVVGAVLLAVTLAVPPTHHRTAIVIGALLTTAGFLVAVTPAMRVTGVNDLIHVVARTALRAVAIVGIVAGVLLIVSAAVNNLPKSSVISAVIIILVGAAAVVSAQHLIRVTQARDETAGSAHGGEEGEDYDPLLPIAIRWRDRIRYQQRYTSGWSGGLKAPIGVEASRRAGSDATDQQLTFPDAVAAIRRFLQQAARDRDVIVAIDELDKIDSPAAARRFLNEIKTIFGIEHCFYLVSVSEDAMSHFERRGLPLRDTLDSAFDEVLHMTTLPVAESRRVLRQRVVGLPVPFLFVTHAMSGGLPRDLIRVTRALIELRVLHGRPLSVHDAAVRLSARDIDRKLRAATYLIRGIGAEPQVSEALRLLHRYASDHPAPGEYSAVASELNQFVDSVAAGGEGRPEAGLLMGIVADMSLMFYFASTAIEYLSRAVTREACRRAELAGRGGGIELLAEARAAFSINRRLAWELLGGLRDAEGISGMVLPPLAGLAPASDPSEMSR